MRTGHNSKANQIQPKRQVDILSYQRRVTQVAQSILRICIYMYTCMMYVSTFGLKTHLLVSYFPE